MPWAVPFLALVFFVAVFITRNPTFSYSLLLIVFPFVAGLSTLIAINSLCLWYSTPQAWGYSWAYNTFPGLEKCTARLGATGAKSSGAAASKKGSSMPVNELYQLTVHDAHELLKQKKISSTELTNPPASLTCKVIFFTPNV
jgi:hypothetical protein